MLALLATQVGIAAAPAGADPAVTGQWTAPFNLGVKGIHSILMPNGKVLLFSYPVSAVGSDARVFDPAAPLGTPTTDVSITWPLDVFCSGTSLLPDGRIFSAGGHVHLAAFGLGIKNTTIFDPATNTWTNGPLLGEERWYPSNLTLGNGHVLVFSGDRDLTTHAPTVDEYDPVANTITPLPASATMYLGLYPRLHVMPDGKILWDNTAHPMVFNPSTNTWSSFAASNFGSRGISGDSVLLPGLNKVLVFGGSPKDNGLATNTAEIVDYSQPNPQWRFTAPLNFARQWSNAVLLPDGTVLAVGGGTKSLYKGSITTPELFDPVAETWTPLAAQSLPRQYHSTAILLPDGRVLSAGHDRGSTTNQLSGEIFSPPYLFKGPRPTIASAPSDITYGSQPYSVSTPDASSIARVALIRPGSVTHADNFDQRYVDLSFSAVDGNTLSITGPSDGNQAPTGYYMLFIVSSSGVPSVASWVHLA